MMRAGPLSWTLIAAVATLEPHGSTRRTPVAAPPDVSAVLASIATYVDGYERTFSAVVAREDYLLALQAAGPRPGGSPSLRPLSRSLRSDVMVLNLGPTQWVQFRDVYEVDGRAVRDHDSRLAALLAKPSANLLTIAHDIANESARYNIGVPRNFNVPTMALAYIARPNQGRSSFTLRGTERVEGTDTTILEFKETASPGLILTESGTVTTHGRFWFVSASGAILRSELTCRVDRPSNWVEGTVDVAYKHQPPLGVLVPATMVETYRRDTGETDTGRATYTDFRVFTVDTQTIRRAGGGGN